MCLIQVVASEKPVGASPEGFFFFSMYRFAVSLRRPAGADVTAGRLAFSHHIRVARFFPSVEPTPSVAKAREWLRMISSRRCGWLA